jgi:sugar lactone lactonase YvrE
MAQCIRGVLFLAVLATALARSGAHAQIVEILDATGAGAGAGLTEPTELAIDGAGNLYVLGKESDNVLRVTPGGVVTEILDATGDGTGNVLDTPAGLAVDLAGNVFVAAHGSLNAFHVSPAGAITEILDLSGLSWGEPEDVAVDGAGNAYIATFGGAVFRYDTSGVLTQLLDPALSPVPLWGTYDIAVEPGGTFYVSCLLDNVVRVDGAGVVTPLLDATGDGLGNTLSDPRGMAVDAAGILYVTGRLSDNVFRVTPAGGITQLLDETATGVVTGGVSPYFDEPLEIDVDAAGNVYVTGAGSSNVWVLDVGGAVTMLASDYAGGAVGGVLAGAWGVLVDGSGSVYVAGTDSDNVFRIGPATATGTLRNVAADALVFTEDGVTLRAQPPVLGASWRCAVSLAGTGHSGAMVFAYTGATNQVLPSGQEVLVGGLELFRLPPLAGSGAVGWTGIPVPGDPVLVGFELHAQALLFGGPTFTLSNAQDLRLGF